MNPYATAQQQQHQPNPYATQSQQGEYMQQQQQQYGQQLPQQQYMDPSMQAQQQQVQQQQVQHQQYQGKWYMLTQKYENGVRRKHNMYDPCTATAFDTTSEALFCGWGSGRITTHNLPDLSIHSSYYASDTPILAILSSPLGPVILSRETLVIYSSGGVPKMKFPTPVRNPNCDPSLSELKLYTCMCFDENMTTLFVGSETEQIHCFDLQYLSTGKSSVRTYDASTPAETAVTGDKETKSGSDSLAATATTTSLSDVKLSTGDKPITCITYGTSRNILCIGKYYTLK